MKINVGLNPRELELLKKKIAKYDRNSTFQKVVRVIIYDICCDIVETSRNNTPIRTGRLRDSHFLNYTKNPGAYRQVFEVGFGTSYGAIVHETHETNDHFLSNAVAYYKPLIPEFIKTRYKYMKSLSTSPDITPKYPMRATIKPAERKKGGN